ncbi:MAG: hypothetical protein GC157_13785 [Frankiales bacterium]|nr:hypothetical protein [Frankiales bacterium]
MAHPRVAALVLAAGLVLSGCGSTGSTQPTAEQQVCSARADVQKAYDTLVTQVQALNFGDAKTTLSQLTSAVDGLVDAEKNLATEKRAAIEPQVTALKATLQGLSQATTAAELGAGLTTAKQQFTDVLSTVATTADCSTST